MSNEKINRALAEAQGLCWHDDTTFEFADKAPPDGWFQCECGQKSFSLPFDNPDYCNDKNAAFSLVEWMRRERLGSFRISDTYSPYAWCVSIDGDDGNEIAHAEHESLPTAIATACHRALGLEKEV